MPRLTVANPKYRKHRASGQAVVTLDGKDHYLGPHGTRASHGEYDRLIGEWLANGRRLRSAPSELTVTELAAAFWRHAQSNYEDSDGELGCFKLVLQILKRLYGRTSAAEFGPLALQAVQHEAEIAAVFPNARHDEAEAARWAAEWTRGWDRRFGRSPG